MPLPSVGKNPRTGNLTEFKAAHVKLLTQARGFPPGPSLCFSGLYCPVGCLGNVPPSHGAWGSQPTRPALVPLFQESHLEHLPSPRHVTLGSPCPLCLSRHSG